MKKVINYLIYTVVGFIVIGVIVYGIQSSDFSKLEKYDTSKGSPRVQMKPNKAKKAFAERRHYSTEVHVRDNGMIDLGDFTVNISDDKMLIANISIEYTDNSNSWFDVEKEKILSKSIVLRNAVIEAMYDTSIHTNSNDVKEKVMCKLNKHLHEGEVTHVYFNKFIIQ